MYTTGADILCVFVKMAPKLRLINPPGKPAPLLVLAPSPKQFWGIWDDSGSRLVGGLRNNLGQ